MKNSVKKFVFGIGVLSIPAIYVYCMDSKTSDFVNVSENILELNHSIDKIDFDKSKSLVKNFNFGTRAFVDNGESVSVEMKGVLGVPENVKEAPIIVILSSNENYLRKNSYEGKESLHGYNYLIENLSSRGFLTLAINTQFEDVLNKDSKVVEDKVIEMITMEHLSALKQAIEGDKSIYNVNVKSKGNLENIGLIGHSTTGRTIFNLVQGIESSNTFKIKGLVSVTPGEALPVANYPDLPTLVLVAEHSPYTTIGFNVFNEIENAVNRESFAGLTYLVGGNSNKFNEMVKDEKLLEEKANELSQISEMKEAETENEDSKDDSSPKILPKLAKGVIEKDDVIKNEKDSIQENSDLIKDAKSHEEFLSSYSFDFFNRVLKESNLSKLPAESTTVTSLYGLNAMNKYYLGGGKGLYSSKKTSLISNSISENLKLSEVIESDVIEMDTAINFNEPTATIDLKLTQVDWEKENAKLRIPMIKPNLSNSNSLKVRWALNSASNLNMNNQTSIKISLRDKKDNISSIVVNPDPALKKIEGREKDNIDIVGGKNLGWSRYTPLSDTIIPLSKFEGIDLTDIKEIVLSFDNSDSGSIFIEEIMVK